MFVSVSSCVFCGAEGHQGCAHGSQPPGNVWTALHRFEYYEKKDGIGQDWIELILIGPDSFPLRSRYGVMTEREFQKTLLRWDHQSRNRGYDPLGQCACPS
jgi:hypothetical protein